VNAGTASLAKIPLIQTDVLNGVVKTEPDLTPFSLSMKGDRLRRLKIPGDYVGHIISIEIPTDLGFWINCYMLDDLTGVSVVEASLGPLMNFLWDVHDKHQLTSFNFREYPTLAAAISGEPVEFDFTIGEATKTIPARFSREETLEFPVTIVWTNVPFSLKDHEDTINFADLIAPYIAHIAINALMEITALEQSIAKMLGTDAASGTQRNNTRQWLETIGEGSANVKSALDLLKVVSDWFVQ
jgi:hypothetical protein